MRALLYLAALVLPAAAADLVNVRDHGAAGDGVADDTGAFQAAIAAGHEQQRHVYVPRGTYRLSAPLVLENIALTGPDAGAWPADINALPQLVPMHRDGPAVHLLAGGALSGVDLNYAWEAEPETGPPAVLISGIGCYVRNCRIRYCWDGIVTDGEHNVGRLNIENVFIVAPRNVGVRVTGTWDVPALRNIEVWNAGPVPRGLERGVGFLLGKNDLIRLTDCFAFAMRHGFLLEDRIEGCTIEGGTWGVMTGCATDFCGSGITIRGEHTLSVSGGTYWNHATSLEVDGPSRVRVTGAELKSNGAPAVVLREADHVVIQGCSLLRPMEEFDAPAVLAEGGRLVLTGNHLESRGVGIRLGAGLRAAVIADNLIDPHGHKPIEGAPEGNESVQVRGNVVSPPAEP